ncbi:hypothetical protein DY000_02036337 [Brassica cretica]|uniref:Uncharacterized protein n=1 Tax=Brassica cretica TaxID=69181 RepID=A0ABQ7BIL0_BRACR|nr:hypothetical protein DY000_02036337 [Brassica cretica]
MKGVKKAYYRPKDPVAKRTVRVPHSSLPEMRGVLNCDLTVTDPIGDDTFVGEKKSNLGLTI